MPISPFSFSSFSVFPTASEQQLFQLVVALQGTAKVGQPGAQIEHFLERLDLPGHVARLEVFELAELQIHLQFRRIGVVAQLVFHGEGKMRLHPFKNGVEIVGIDFDKLAILQLGSGCSGCR